MTHLEQALHAQAGWLLAASRSLAHSLGRGVEAEDVMQEVVLEALEKIQGDWFDRAPHLSLDAQMRDCLNWALLHVRTRHVRARKRRGLLPAKRGEDGQSIDDDPYETVPDDGPKPDDWLDGGNILDAVRRLRSARRRLLLLMLQSPHFVTRQDIVAATAETTGGGALPRTAEEIWGLWPEVLRSDARRKAADWKLCVVELLYFDEPLGSIPPEALKARANAADKLLSNTRKELRALLAEEDA